MGFFDGLTQSLLRETPSGARVLTLWGRRPRRFLVTPEQERSLKRLEIWFYSVLLVLLFASLQVWPWIAVLLVSIPLVVVAHFAALARFTRHLTPTAEAPAPTTRTALARRNARSMGKPELLLGLIVSLIFVALGFWILSSDAKSTAWLTIGFFSLCALSLAWQLLITRRP